jgi:hypothetical protein
MNWITVDQFDELYPQPTIIAPSIPMICYDFSGQIHVFPRPNQPVNVTGYGMELRYYKVPTKITAITDVPNVPEEFNEYLFLDAFAQAMEKRNRYDVSQELQQQRDNVEIDIVDRYGASLQDADPYVIDSPLIHG